MMTLQQALELLQTQIPEARLVGDGQTRLDRVHSDSRTVHAGDFFVALVGEHFDAHHFLAQARAAGAAAALAQHGLAQAGLSGIEVPDSLKALGVLAQAWRSRFVLPVIAVTGSNGKTTVTQMLAAILQAQAGDAALATQGNFNNSIGMPLNVLRLREHHRLAVIEMGMNHPGEIAELAAIGQATVALVNNAQREHQEFMHTVEAVAQENGSVIAALPADGVAVFPAGDTYTALWRELAGERRCMLFGQAADGAQVYAEAAHWQVDAWRFVLVTPLGRTDATLHVAGRHNLLNALAAAACAVAAGVSLAAIAQGLSAFVAVAGRSRSLQLQVGARALTLVDDSYNANPDSMEAAIEVLSELPGPHCLVMGDMAEVGSQGLVFHSEAGALAQARGITQLLALGAQSRAAVTAFGDGAQHFQDMASLQAAVCKALPGMGSILVKGSRSMKMEQVVQAVLAAAQTPATHNGEAACC